MCELTAAGFLSFVAMDTNWALCSSSLVKEWN